MPHEPANHLTVNYLLIDRNSCRDSERRITRADVSGILATLKSRLHTGSIVASLRDRTEGRKRRVKNVSKVSLSGRKREKVVGILPSGADSSAIYMYVCVYI